MSLIHNTWLKMRSTRHIIEKRKNNRTRWKDTKLGLDGKKYSFKKNHIKRNTKLVSIRIITHKPFMRVNIAKKAY
jgi:hypothetical protein